MENVFVICFISRTCVDYKTRNLEVSDVYDHTTRKAPVARLITEVKPGRAKLVLGWVTAWEYFVL